MRERGDMDRAETTVERDDPPVKLQNCHRAYERPVADLRHERAQALLDGAPKLVAGNATEADRQCERLVDVRLNQVCAQALPKRFSRLCYVRLNRPQTGSRSRKWCSVSF